jgi:signal peptidase I
MDNQPIILRDIPNNREIYVFLNDILYEENNILKSPDIKQEENDVASSSSSASSQFCVCPEHHNSPGECPSKIESRISLSKIYERCSEEWSDFSTDHLMLFYNGKPILSNKEPFFTIKIEEFIGRVFYFLYSSIDFDQFDSEEFVGNIKVDDVSMKAANNWLSMNIADPNCNQTLLYTIMAFQSKCLALFYSAF